jgi:hypothetical protein
MKWVERIKHLLTPDEEIEFVCAEHRIGSLRVFAPAIFFGTSKRIIIARRDILHIHKKYRIIKYDLIVDVELEHGIIFSKVHFGLQNEPGESEEKKWLSGLSHDDAVQLVRFVEKMRPTLNRTMPQR